MIDRILTHDGTDGTLPERNWAPTRASTAVALLGTAGGVAVLGSAVGVRKGVVASAVGAVCLASALWLLTWEQWRVPAALTASLLLVPAGAGIAAGVGYESLVTFAASFPAATPTRVVGQILRMLGVLAVLWGCTVAVFGASASVRSVATRRSVTRCLDAVVRVTVLPAVFFAGLAAHALVTNFDLGAADVVGDVVSGIADWLFAPAPDRLHLVAFWLLLEAATYATNRALRTLPLRELAGEATVGDVPVAEIVAGVRRVVGGLVAVVGFTLPFAFLVGLAVPAERVRDAVPASVFDALVALTSAPGLRHLLANVALVAGALALVAGLVRRSSRVSTRDLLVGYAPFVAGMSVVAGVGVAHRPALLALVDFVAGRLDAPLAAQFRDATGRVVEFYGPETVVLGLTAGVLVLATLGVFGLYLSFALGFVTDRVAGPSFAGAGLFLAAAFAGTLDASLPLVLAGLVVAVVVWDAGEFATTLGEEVGRRARTRRVELLHALGSLSVGVLAAVVAAGLARVVPSGQGSAAGSSVELGGLSLALLAAVAGAVLLVMALR